MSHEPEPKRGRPPSVSPGEPVTSVSITMPARVYDRVYEVAVKERISVPEFIRQAITQELKTTK